MATRLARVAFLYERAWITLGGLGSFCVDKYFSKIAHYNQIIRHRVWY